MTRTTSMFVAAAVLATGTWVSSSASAQEMIQRNCDFNNLGAEAITTEERFMRIDTNRSGYVDRKELVECMWPGDFTGRERHRWGEVVSLADETIKTYDDDGDEVISKDEAVNAMTK